MKIKLACYIVLAVFFSLSSVDAFPPGAVWKDGMVTRAPWHAESFWYVEVDAVAYKIIPDIRVSYRYRRNEKAYNEEASHVQSIYPGQKIWMKVRKNDIFQIILF